MFLYINFSICGFLHPDVAFGTIMVEKVEKPEEERQTQTHMVPLGRAGILMVEFPNDKKEAAEDENGEEEKEKVMIE